MKKKILLLATVLSLGFAANVFAATASSTSGSAAGWVSQTAGGVRLGLGTAVNGTATPFIDLKPSANVLIFYTVYGTGTSYVSGSAHTSGIFTYGTSSLDTNIYRTGYVSGTDTTMPAVASGAVAWTGWTAAR